MDMKSIREQIREQLEEQTEEMNFVIQDCHARDLEPTARCYYNPDKKSVDISISTPPGNAYNPVRGEFFIRLGYTPADSFKYHIKGDGDDSVPEDDKWESEQELKEQVSYNYIQKSLSIWIDEIESEIDKLIEENEN